MAKQLVGPVERHLEKAIVGVAGLLLVGVIARYLVTSPNYLELGGETVNASTIDAKVADKSADVRSKIQRHREELEVLEPLFPEFVRKLDAFASNELPLEFPMAVSFGPPVPIIDTPEVIKGRKKLATVVRLPKPAATTGRSTFDFSDGAGENLHVHNWVTVSVVFDRERQIKLQKQQYGAKHDEITFGGVELERRLQRDDGSWSDEDWEFVEDWPEAEIPPRPNVTLFQEKGQVTVVRDSYNAVVFFQDELSAPRLQVRILRPLMPDVYNGDPWTFPPLIPYKEVLGQDREYLDPDGTDDEIEDRYGLGEEEDPGDGEEEELTLRETFKRSLESAEQKLISGRRNWSRDDAIEAFNLAMEVFMNRDAGGADKAKARKITDAASQLIRDIDRRPKQGQKPEGAEEGKRELLPTQQVWANDAKRGSVRSGETYQYRIRLVLYNELAAAPAQFEAKEDAAVVLIAGEWSEPSDPVAVGADTHFFATGCDERKQEVKFELYHWFDGVWVTHRWSFGVGQAVMGMSREPVPIPGEEDVDKPEVSFEPGVMVVDIDFKRPYRDRKAKGGGVTLGGAATSTCSVVLVDSAGELTERFILSDKANPMKRTLAKAVFKPEKR